MASAAPIGLAGQPVAYARHPAALGRESDAGAASHGFGAIVTWFPHAAPVPAPACEPVRLPAESLSPVLAPPAERETPPTLPPVAAGDRSEPTPIRTMPPEPERPALPVRPLPVLRTAPGDELDWPAFTPALPRPLALDRQWAVEPPSGPVQLASSPRRRQLAGAAVLAMVALAGLSVAGIRYGAGWFAPGQIAAAVFNAPMLVVRASLAGRVMTVPAMAGEAVQPQSPLLTFRASEQPGLDRPVLAGVHGVVRSVETVPGSDIAAGTPLMRLYDCDRAFLTIPAGTALQAGQDVRVKLPELPPLTGRVRPAAGIMEPSNALVIGLPPGAMAESCPVGATAAVSAARS